MWGWGMERNLEKPTFDHEKIVKMARFDTKDLLQKLESFVLDPTWKSPLWSPFLQSFLAAASGPMREFDQHAINIKQRVLPGSKTTEFNALLSLMYQAKCENAITGMLDAIQDMLGRLQSATKEVVISNPMVAVLVKEPFSETTFSTTNTISSGSLSALDTSSSTTIRVMDTSNSSSAVESPVLSPPTFLPQFNKTASDATSLGPSTFDNQTSRTTLELPEQEPTLRGTPSENSPLLGHHEVRSPSCWDYICCAKRKRK